MAHGASSVRPRRYVAAMRVAGFWALCALSVGACSSVPDVSFEDGDGGSQPLVGDEDSGGASSSGGSSGAAASSASSSSGAADPAAACSPPAVPGFVRCCDGLQCVGPGCDDCFAESDDKNCAPEDCSGRPGTKKCCISGSEKFDCIDTADECQ